MTSTVTVTACPDHDVNVMTADAVNRPEDNGVDITLVTTTVPKGTTQVFHIHSGRKIVSIKEVAPSN